MQHHQKQCCTLKLFYYKALIHLAHYTVCDNPADIIHAVGAVFIKPLHHNCRNPHQIKLKDVLPVLFRNTKPEKNRIEDIIEKAVVNALKSHCAKLFYRSFEKPPVFFYKSKVRSQILRGDKHECLEWSALKLFGGDLGFWRKAGKEAVCNILSGFSEQIRRILVMKIKGGAVNFGELADFLNGNILKILLFQKAYKGFVHFHGSIEVLAFVFIHQRPSL